MSLPCDSAEAPVRLSRCERMQCAVSLAWRGRTGYGAEEGTFWVEGLAAGRRKLNGSQPFLSVALGPAELMVI